MKMRMMVRPNQCPVVEYEFDVPWSVQLELTNGLVIEVTEVNDAFEISLRNGTFLLRPAMSNVIYLEGRQ